MKVLYAFGQITNRLLPFYSIHFCHEISSHLLLRQVIQINYVCIVMYQITMVYSFLIT